MTSTIDPTKVRYAVFVDFLKPDNTQGTLKQSFATLEDAEAALYAQIATGVFRFTPKDYGDYPGAPYVLYVPMHRVLNCFVWLEVSE
jgi:hypothetical protein